MIASFCCSGTTLPAQSGQSGHPSPDSVTRTIPPTATSAQADAAAASASSRKPRVGRIGGIQASDRLSPLIEIDQDASIAVAHTRAKRLYATGGSDVSTTTPSRTPRTRPAEPIAQPSRTRFIEAVLDNLPAWAVVAAAIAYLYLVWATLEI